MNAVWISFSELDKMNSGGNFKQEFSNALKECRDFNITDIFIHTVAFCDSIYPSQIYPTRAGYSTKDFDVLEYAVKAAHKENIKIHAWMNPYRVKTSSNSYLDLPDKNPAKKWLCDQNEQNDKNVCITQNGIYLNPAESEVRRTVIGAVKEVISNYDVDGVHFDDYFYPTTDPSFDVSSYEEYKKSCQKPLCLEEYRKNAVNALISGCYTAIKFKNKDLVFSVSPAASLQNDRDKLYADVSAWCKSGCVDVIIPQLYFGFQYPDPNFRFDNLIKTWKTVTENTETKLVIGLAPYKIDTDKVPDSAEWASDYTVLEREYRICKEDKSVFGVAFFSLGSLFGNGVGQTAAREGIKKVK